MNFGLLLIIRNPPEWHRPDHEVYKGYIDNAVRGEELGFTHAWTSEHHFLPDGWSPAQLPILAAIAARTSRIRVGTLVLLLALHNPLRVAEDAATVDIISNGRMDLAVGLGPSTNECATFGIPYNQRRGRVYEGIEIIQRCFSEEEFSFKGKYYEFNNVRMTTKPVQKPLPIWFGASDERSLRDAGARGLQLAAGPSREMQKVYEDSLQAAGHNPKKFQRSVHRMIHVAETTEKAWDEAEAPLQFHMIWHFKMMAERPQGAAGMDLSIPPLGELRKTGKGPYGPAYVGTPDEVARQLEENLQAYPLTELSMTPGLPGMDSRIARRSMELFAKEVMPHFKNKSYI